MRAAPWLLLPLFIVGFNRAPGRSGRSAAAFSRVGTPGRRPGCESVATRRPVR